ncbi:MDR family oxidoreductase [Pseudarthrobacter enclensis]|uniref:Acrylyl-CoA reductase (NADPH) n=1 Tax=Pseudarthrobacter enclensis TaxID=993070 RepID=A0ABT9S0N2_9MICC|nr:MDR family oxidoreductase [Pseudarthrobacter enclensis]MDP9890606.1 acrylyl-CoA reductase (NADPH) [Pseudarthrobacter enclensis]
MNNLTYRAYQVSAPKQEAELVTLTESDLPEGDLTVRVRHSSLNYKDGLAMTGKPGVVRTFPLTCGIDLAGTVVDAGGGFANGDEVVLTGANLSETRPGGYSGYQRIEAESVLKAPVRLGTWGAMAVGTAGLTAMLCILRLRGAGIDPGSGPVLVTGATGGVGSFAVGALSRLGYEVHASTGKDTEEPYLKNLGATEVIPRESLAAETPALGKQRWIGCIDSVGGATLANVLSQIKYSGAVASCGLAGGLKLPTTVMPFILRNVSLLGVDSVNASPELRREAWAELDDLFAVDDLRAVAIDAGWEQLPKLSHKILTGSIRGRVVVDITGMAN